jgi:hypothetical protein
VVPQASEAEGALGAGIPFLPHIGIRMVSRGAAGFDTGKIFRLYSADGRSILSLFSNDISGASA